MLSSILGPQHFVHSLARPEGFVPVTLKVVGTSGLNETLEVDLSGTPTQDETVSISTSTPGAFTSIPAYTTVPAGQISGYFTVTLTSTATQWNVTVSAAGGYVSHTWLNY